MNELQLQSVIIDAVRDHGSFGYKASHKFLVGVPDLYIKLRNAPTGGFWEVKVRDELRDPNHPFKPPLTKLQQQFLKEHARCGGFSGVISLVRGNRTLLMAAVPFLILAAGDDHHKPFTLTLNSHFAVERIGRFRTIVEILRRAHDAADLPDPGRDEDDQSQSAAIGRDDSQEFTANRFGSSDLEGTWRNPR